VTEKEKDINNYSTIKKDKENDKDKDKDKENEKDKENDKDKEE